MSTKAIEPVIGWALAFGEKLAATEAADILPEFMYFSEGSARGVAEYYRAQGHACRHLPVLVLPIPENGEVRPMWEMTLGDRAPQLFTENEMTEAIGGARPFRSKNFRPVYVIDRVPDEEQS